MYIYEVNLDIQLDVYDKYMTWLKTHINEMLKIKGFQSAQVYYRETTEKNTNNLKLITVHYEVDSQESLNNYFEKQAPQMRQEGIKLFDTKFSATRRVLKKVKT